MMKSQLALLTALLFLALTLPTSSASLTRLTYDQIQSQSDLIVLGKVTGSISHTDSGNDTGNVPYLIRHVQVQQYYKGSGSQSIDVKELGGDLGYWNSVWVEDQPELSVGTTYVLFLKADGYGSYYVYGGPEGALAVVDGVASNSVYALRVADSGLVPVPASNVSVAGFFNETYTITNGPTTLEIKVGGGTEFGYWTFHVTFDGVSGEAKGLVSEDKVSDFVYGYGSYVSFSHNFTVPGVYRVVVDGVSCGQLEVKPGGYQMHLTWAEFSSEPLFVDEPITLRVGSIPSNMTGEYRAVAVVTPRLDEADPYYESYASYTRDSNWFTFNFLMREPGNYTLTIWQNGVKQLARKFMVINSTSTGGGPTKPDSAAFLAAELAASRTANTSTPSASDVGTLPDAANRSNWYPLEILLLIMVIATLGFLFYRIRGK
jgi:hypothetical protein